MRILTACLLLAAGDARARPCVVESKSVEAFAVDVASKGGPTLRLRIAGVPVTARWATTKEGPPPPVAVEVKGALGFSATAAANKVPLKPKRQVDAANGMLRLSAGAGQLTGRALHTFVSGELLIEDVRIRPVLLPCEALTLDAVESPAPSGEPGPGETLVPKSTTIKMYPSPGQGEPMEVTLKNAGDLELHRNERMGAWVSVTSRFHDGSALTAWVKADELTKPTHRELQDLPTLPPPCTRAPEAKGALKLAPATLVAGTPISADRLFPWATARGGDSLTVRYKEGDSWVEIVGVPGITAPSECEGSTVLDEAWVPRSAVKLAGAAPDGGTK